jgi:hypothetical protein
VYLYNYRSTGTETINNMKALAGAGQGLHAFITTQVKSEYARRLR